MVLCSAYRHEAMKARVEVQAKEATRTMGNEKEIYYRLLYFFQRRIFWSYDGNPPSKCTTKIKARPFARDDAWQTVHCTKCEHGGWWSECGGLIECIPFLLRITTPSHISSPPSLLLFFKNTPACVCTIGVAHQQAAHTANTAQYMINETRVPPSWRTLSCAALIDVCRCLSRNLTRTLDPSPQRI